MSGSRDERTLRVRLYEIVFEADTLAGQVFDVALLVCIVVSVALTILETVRHFWQLYAKYFQAAEILFATLFGVEYVLRSVVAQPYPSTYMCSFFGVVDLCAVLPTLIEDLVASGSGTAALRIVRVLRLLRVFRVLQFTGLTDEAEQLLHVNCSAVLSAPSNAALHALFLDCAKHNTDVHDLLLQAFWNARRKIIVFLAAILTTVTILGTIVYILEDNVHSGFTSIPRSIYWAIVTVTTVGYGDIAPQTVAGQTVASIMMTLGYSILAVPTGIAAAELHSSGNSGDSLRQRAQRRARRGLHPVATVACTACESIGHDGDALYCKYCGQDLRGQSMMPSAAIPDF